MTEKRRARRKARSKKAKAGAACLDAAGSKVVKESPVAAGLSCCKPWRAFVQGDI